MWKLETKSLIDCSAQWSLIQRDDLVSWKTKLPEMLLVLGWLACLRYRLIVSLLVFELVADSFTC